MRVFLLAACLAAFPSLASAQVGYLEGAIGLALIQAVETETYSLSDPSFGDFIGHGELEFGGELSAGAEVGIAAARWRFGVSWDYATANLDTGRLIGTLNGAPYSEEGTGEEIEALTGVSFDEIVHVVAANAYYNIGAPDASFRPYIGLGAGMAMFQNADPELALHATAGARFALGPSAYIGGRYRFTRIQGPEDDLGISYEPIMLHTFSLLIGVYLGGP